MNRRIVFLSLSVLFFAVMSSFALESVRISGIDIPLPEGAEAVRIALPQSAQAKISSYEVGTPLYETVEFYERFLKENGFVIIGGMGETGYSASIKKNAAMFTLNIYPRGDKTVIQFIW